MIETGTTIRGGIVKRIHVDQHRMKANKRDGTNLPFLTVQARGTSHKAHEVIINGPSRLVTPGKTLTCGASTWIETTAEVQTIVDEQL